MKILDKEIQLLNKQIQPIIKWTGSKKSQASYIVEMFPYNIKTYYEPFVGSGSVLIKLLQFIEYKQISVDNIQCSDLNEDLINCWNLIKDDKDYLLEKYKELYNKFSILDYQGKKDFYNNIRNNFNKWKLLNDHQNIDEATSWFFWLRRTSFNGLVRYNSKGELNTSCHFTRNGIIPEKLKPLLDYWSDKLNKYNVKFKCCSYLDLGNDFDYNDFLYLDPPYMKSNGMYFSEDFNQKVFFNWLNKCKKAYWALSYDGIAGNKDFTYDIKNELKYDTHLYLKSGNSSFRRLKNLGNINVRESLYVNYPQTKDLWASWL